MSPICCNLQQPIDLLQQNFLKVERGSQNIHVYQVSRILQEVTPSFIFCPYWTPLNEKGRQKAWFTVYFQLVGFFTPSSNRSTWKLMLYSDSAWSKLPYIMLAHCFEPFWNSSCVNCMFPLRVLRFAGRILTLNSNASQSSVHHAFVFALRLSEWHEIWRPSTEFNPLSHCERILNRFSIFC